MSSTHRFADAVREANDVLREALSTSAKVGLTDSYNTLNRSCGTDAFAVLDLGIGEDVSLMVRFQRATTGERLPPLAEKSLAMRGLLFPGHEPVDLNAEWARAPRSATPR